MSVDVWIRARSGPALGIGHRVRALILAEAIAGVGKTTGLILDSDAAEVPAGIAVYHLPAGLEPPEEAFAYPTGMAPVILDLSHPTMLDDLPELVCRLRAQGRRIGLIDGLGHEAYAGKPLDSTVDIVLTPYVLEPDAQKRSARVWLPGARYAVLDPAYAQAPVTQAGLRTRTVLVFISGTDPWQLTEAVVSALAKKGLPPSWQARVVIGPGFDEARRDALHRLAEGCCDIGFLHEPATLRDALCEARLALLGPGLAKYEAAACGTYSLIVSPDAQYAQMNQPFEAQGLARVLNPGPPQPELLHTAILDAAESEGWDPRSLIDGAGAARAATRFVSELFTESGESSPKA